MTVNDGRVCGTCGFCRKVCLWLEQPPQRFNSGSALLVQLPKCTTSCHVLWMLMSDVLMRRQTSASVKSLHQSVNDILLMWTDAGVTGPTEGGDKLHWWRLRQKERYQNSPSSSTVMPRLPLSASPIFAHSSELASKEDGYQLQSVSFSRLNVAIQIVHNQQFQKDTKKI